MTTDINKHSLILKYTPSYIEPYIRLARLDRPIGIWLTLLPCWWSLGLASLSQPFPYCEFIICMVGAFIVRSAGCICNDLIDQKFDAEVTRTKSRPLVDGSLKKHHALIFLCLLIIVGFILLLFLSQLTILIGLLTSVMIMVYPWMKRITNWPQAFLGLTFNMGIFIGWAMLSKEFSLTPFMLYGAAFFWTLHYDTIYACQDKRDDKRIGVQSTALYLGNKVPLFLLFCTTCVGTLLLAVGFINNLSTFYLTAVTLISAYLCYQSVNTDLDNPSICLQAFKKSQWVGWIVLIGIILSRIKFPLLITQ